MKRGFTLLEILVVVAIISVLAGIVIVAINPGHQLALTRDAQRKGDVVEIRKSIVQYYIDHKVYPIANTKGLITYEICNTTITETNEHCLPFINISGLIPVYVNGTPVDPIVPKTRLGSGYNLAISSEGVYVEAPNTEIGVGPEKLIAHDGRPPQGYVIPRVISSEEVKQTFTERARESATTLVTNSHDWFRIVGIGSIFGILIILYIHHRRIRAKRGPLSSLLN